MTTPPPPQNSEPVNAELDQPKRGVSPVVGVLLLLVSIVGGIYVLKESGLFTEIFRSTSVNPQDRSSVPTPERRVEFPDSIRTLGATSQAKASERFYLDYMREATLCQTKAEGIWTVAQKVDISPTGPDYLGNIYTSVNLGGVQKALKLSAGFYEKAARHRQTLSTAGVDPEVLAYVDRLVALDRQAQDILEIYAQDPSSRPASLTINMNQRVAWRADEAQFLANMAARHGINLPTSKTIGDQQSAQAREDSSHFVRDNDARKIVNVLVGSKFTNLLTGGVWTIDPGEFVEGKVVRSTSQDGNAVVELEATLVGSRSRNPCKIKALLIAVEDPVINMFWVVYSANSTDR